MSKVCQCEEEKKGKNLKSLERSFTGSQENVTPLLNFSLPLSELEALFQWRKNNEEKG